MCTKERVGMKYKNKVRLIFTSLPSGNAEGHCRRPNEAKFTCVLSHDDSETPCERACLVFSHIVVGLGPTRWFIRWIRKWTETPKVASRFYFSSHTFDFQPYVNTDNYVHVSKVNWHLRVVHSYTPPFSYSWLRLFHYIIHNWSSAIYLAHFRLRYNIHNCCSSATCLASWILHFTM